MQGALAEKVSDAGFGADAPNVAPPPGNPKFELFDAMRAVAALCVFGAHLLIHTSTPEQHPFFEWAPQLAAQGVAIFFLISGFLLYRPFLVARQNGRQLTFSGYATRRVLRIVPAYWLALFVVVVVLQHNDVGHDWWIHAAFGQVYFDATRAGGIGVAWSLCVEVTFYIVLPLIAWAGFWLGRGRLRGDIALLAALTMASLAFRILVAPPAGQGNSWLAHTLPGSFLWFALGMALAIGSVALSSQQASVRFVSQHPNLMWVSALASFTTMYLFISGPGGATGGRTLEHVAYGVTALFLLLPAVFGEHAGGALRRVLGTRALAWIGVVSYGFYLYHADVFNYIDARPEFEWLPKSVPLLGAYTFVATLALAAASYYLVERPILRLKHRTFPYRRPGKGSRRRNASPQDVREPQSAQ
ncbi:MAG: acyltransferase [Thermoleophilaceae bacterium]|nr:acyltransferase [Thermoleophilaceae bacterium]